MAIGRVALGVLLCVIAAGCAASDDSTREPRAEESTPLDETAVVRDLVYAEVSSESATTRALDIYTPGGADHADVVVLLHGGDADRRHSDVVAVARQLADAGLVVFVPDHAIRGDPAGILVNDGQRMREGVENTLCALRYAALHAADNGGDGARISIVGHGAGGFIGLMPVLGGPELGSNWQQFAVSRDLPEEVLCVAAVPVPSIVGFVGFNGAYFVFLMSDISQSDPDLWALANPRDYVVEDSARLAFILGGNDRQTPGWHSEEVRLFAEELGSFGYDAQVVDIADAAHGWTTVGPIWDRTLETILAVVSTT